MTEINYRMAKSNEREKIQEFLKNNWNPDFSVARSDDLFDYLYKDDKSNIQFALAVSGKKIIATLGLIIYENSGADRKDISLTLWASSEKSGSSGIRLLEFVVNGEYRSISSVGVRKNVLIFYQMLKIPTGKMSHHFLLNHDRDYFNIFKGNKNNFVNSISDVTAPTGYLIEEVKWFDSEPIQDSNQILKTCEYLNKRYFQHPVYRYRVFKINRHMKFVAYAVCKIVHANCSSVIRLVDWIGSADAFPEFANMSENVLLKEGHEYMDFYSANFPIDVLESTNFFDREKYDVVVPNYFEPFISKNEDKYYLSSLPGAYLFKGDGDADRPFKLMEPLK